jgi:hypothetical protein
VHVDKPSCVMNDIHSYNRGMVFEDEFTGRICLRMGMTLFMKQYCGEIGN